MIRSVHILWIIISCIVLGCSKQDKTNGLVEQSDTIVNIDASIMDSIEFSTNNTDIIFVVDASCSTCIAVLLKELHMIKENGWDSNYELGSYHIILPEGTLPITRHYISEQSILSHNEYHFIELSDKYIDFIEMYNGCFFMVDNGVITEMWMPSDNIY